eukprot:1153692-Pelagomonas_calceolata.AAC.3
MTCPKRGTCFRRSKASIRGEHIRERRENKENFAMAKVRLWSRRSWHWPRTQPAHSATTLCRSRHGLLCRPMCSFCHWRPSTRCLAPFLLLTTSTSLTVPTFPSMDITPPTDTTAMVAMATRGTVCLLRSIGRFRLPAGEHPGPVV